MLKYSILILITFGLLGCKENSKSYQLTTKVLPDSTGEVIPSDGIFSRDEEVELIAIAVDGYIFDKWTGDIDGSDNPRNVLMDSDKNITAHFERKLYNLNLTVAGEGEVIEKVIKEPQKAYEFETVVELTPITDYGWEFDRWTGSINSTDSVIQVKIEDNLDVTANFKRSLFNLDIQIIGEGSLATEVIENRRKSFEYGSYVELTPMPASLWEFIGWGGELSGTTVPEYILLDSSRTVGLEFKRQFRNYFNLDGQIRGGEIFNSGALVLYGIATSSGDFFDQSTAFENEGFLTIIDFANQIQTKFLVGGLKNEQNL